MRVSFAASEFDGGMPGWNTSLARRGMRLTFFAQAFLPVIGGAEIFLDALATRLCQRGHEVTVLAASRKGAIDALEAPYRLVRYRKPFYRRVLPSHGAWPLLREHLRAPPECVHAHGAFPPGDAVRAYCRWVGRPWTVRPMGFDVLPGELVRSNPRSDRRMRRALRSANRVIAQSADLERVIVELGVPRERVARIPNAVDVEPFARRRFERAPRPTIAAMGVFHRKKGFDVLIAAFHKLLERVPDARLTLAGDGEERNALVALAGELGVRDRIDLPGFVRGDDKLRVLQSAWVFVSSSRREPFSNANLEAQASGLPMVATAVGGNLEIVADGLEGLLVPPEDATALASALERLLCDASARQRMGARSIEKAREYGWTRVVDRYEELYRELAAGAGAR